VSRRALVTGGAGFIGSHLVDRLLREGWTVTTVDSFDDFYDPRIKRGNVRPHLALPNFKLVEADIRDLDSLTRQLDGRYDVIVHIAARAGVRPSIERPLLYQEVNVRGTHNLLELCRQWGVRQFVFASSSSVYGVNPNVPWREDDPVLLPISPYASTKISGELLGHVYSHLFGIRFVALRFFTVYGPRQRPDLAIRRFSELMRRGERIPFFGTGEALRDYTYVDDIIEGLIAAMHYDTSMYEVINLGNGNAVSLTHLVSLLENALGVTAILERLPTQAGDVPRTWASGDKARRLLGFAPSTDINTGIVRFVAWLDREAELRTAD
jgi:UDP-glucuronate 4-epimerase